MVVLGQYGPKPNIQTIFPIQIRWLADKLPAFLYFYNEQLIKFKLVTFTVREIHLTVAVGGMEI